METTRPIATLDFETDPFKHGRIVKPFAWDFFDGQTHHTYWGNDCVNQLMLFLDSLVEDYIIYAHNGGNFDFMFMLRRICGKMLLINNRIVKAGVGKHEIRDSFAILPVALSTYSKLEIDYKKLEMSVRGLHQTEIVTYLHYDTKALHELVSRYRAVFGNALTMAGAAYKKLQEFHPTEKMTENTDAYYRRFYFGGRVECFERGIIRAPVKIYDVNGMYQDAMRCYLHPISESGYSTAKIARKTCFVDVEGESFGAFPVRNPETGGIDFPHGRGTFSPSIHEYEAAIETGLFKPKKIIAAWNFDKRITFQEFIDNYYHLKVQAETDKEPALRIFWKGVMCSSYGKFAQDPRKFCDYEIREIKDGTPNGKLCICSFVGEHEGSNRVDKQEISTGCTCGGWSFTLCNEDEGWRVWTKPSPSFQRTYYNVATAASITGAARSILLRGIASSKRPLYCDTDSLICEELGRDQRIDAKELGAWKFEHDGDLVAICGKKTYAVFDKGECIKLASKGAKLTPRDVMRIARGRTVVYKQPAPRFKLDGSVRFIERRIRATR